MGKGSQGPAATASVKPSAPLVAAKERKTLQIDGVVYDVTNFKHPGGSIIKYMAVDGLDATDAYREFHFRSSKADKFLKSLPRVDGPVTSLYDAKELARREAMTRDFAAFRAELEREGFFKPSVPHMLYRMAEIFALFSVSFWLIGQWQLPLAVVAGVLVNGVAQGRCGWLMHEQGHYSFSGYIPLDRRLQEFFYGVGCGMSAAFWTNQHSKHHATPQKLQHDVDLDTLPLIAFNEAVAHKVKPGSLLAKWLSVQAYLFAPVSCVLVGLGWTLFLHPRHMIRTRRYAELAFAASRYVGWFTLLAAQGYAFQQSLGLYVACFGLGCIYIFCNFALSHTHLPVTGADEHAHWLEYGAKYTTNIAIDSAFVTWWMSYLNFQVEHHLFPSAPQFRFPQIAPRVKALFDKHGLHYDVRGYFQAMGDTFSNLYAVGNASSPRKHE